MLHRGYCTLHVAANVVLDHSVHVVHVVRGHHGHVDLLAVQSCSQVRLVGGGTEEGRLVAPAGGLAAERGEHVVPESPGHHGVQLLARVEAVGGEEGVVSGRSGARSDLRPGTGVRSLTSFIWRY